MVGESHDNHHHWHLLDPDGGFVLDPYYTEAEAIARATVLQSFEPNNERFYHLLGVSDLCKCVGENE